LAWILSWSLFGCSISTNPIDNNIPDGGAEDAACLPTDGCPDTWAKKFFSPSGTNVSANTIVHLNQDGEIEWQAAYDLKTEASTPRIKNTKDGGYLLAFRFPDYYTENDLVGLTLVRISSIGTIEWEKSFVRDRNFAWVSAIVETDDGYVIGGTLHEVKYIGCIIEHNTDYFVMKIDHQGEFLWQTFIDWPEPISPEVDNVAATADGSIFLMIPYNLPPYPENIIVKLAPGGSIEWAKSLSCNSYYERHSKIHSSNDNFFWLTRSIATFNKGNGILIARINLSGEIEWQKAIVRHPAEVSITKDIDGILLLAQQEWITKIDFSGNILWRKKPGKYGVLDRLFEIMSTTDGGYFLISEDFVNSRMLIKLDQDFETSDNVKSCIGHIEEFTDYEVILDTDCKYEDVEVQSYDVEVVAHPNVGVKVTATDFSLLDYCSP
jgi:hypothetical protein